ncbi:phenol 2-monooxygenase [Microbacterium sp. Root61]|uniref:FAD-binding monooxygenase n=1 Tax=Microbacterium sp. Root61 TaxID=1736570 RepID=UPI0006FA24C0|nr:FAD-binding monooxygenase [Microbacterium sp. Root61]KRA25457.1 phenol 2-monooxygenase [Microbacterium sp. Root61]
MQSYLNGFRPGDPEKHPVDPTQADTGLPDEVDVLIVGTGPAGLVLAAQLAAFPDIRTRVVERRDGALQMGQADGLACRSVEMFDAFGFSARLLRESYWVNETVFWRPDAQDRSSITRSGRIQDVEDGLSEFPHVILNQARVQDFLLDSMRDSASHLEPDYGLDVTDVQVADTGSHPVTVTMQAADGTSRDVRAKYVVGCDGARSAVRRSIGRELKGDSANQAWGVMDVLAVTDYPDIRFKSVIQSAEVGNMIIIPREGGYMVRLYIEMDELQPGERVAERALTSDDVIAAAQRILHPHRFDVQEIVWWSIYEIGQRLTDKFDDVPEDEIETRLPHVFIAGDACHTHSPKAGQGMNVSMQDAFNLGWKLAAVLEGRSAPALLHTYSAERQSVAGDLIRFDKEWAAMMSAKPLDTMTGEGVDPDALQNHFQKQGRYTAGMATQYQPSLLTGGGASQHLAAGFPIGERFHSAQVMRLADAKQMELGHVAQADGRWRLYAFADRRSIDDPQSRLRAFCAALAEGPDSPIARFTPAGADLDAVLDVRGILQQPHTSVEPTALPEILRPHKGRYGLADYEKAFTANAGVDIFDARGVDRESGCLVLVRPDQYVAHVLPLDGIEELTDFLGRFMLPVGTTAAANSSAR